MNNTQKLSARLLNTILDIVSVLIFPIVFSINLKIHPFSNYKYVIIYIGLIYIYKNIFIPKKPNTFFDTCYMILLLLLTFIFGIKINIFVTIISIIQLALFILAKNYKKIAPLLSEVTFNFITPSFFMIIMTYSFTKFFSFNYLVLILVINAFALATSYIEINYQSILGIVLLFVILLIIYSFKYITLFNTLFVGIVLIVITVLKYLKNISVNPNLMRIILSFLQIL